MKGMTKAVATIITALAMTACSGEKFNIEGQITGAADSLLYFENVALKGTVKLDSVKLDADGKFAFEGDRPEAPDFYRLRIAGQIINVSIDSTETVGIKAEYNKMGTGYEVTGSDNCMRIKELAVKQIDLQKRIFAVDRATMAPQEKSDSILTMLAAYKKDVMENYIFIDPTQTSSYFALFQTVGRYLIFDPYNNEDMKAFAAVATCWDAFYHESERSKNLYNLTMSGINNKRAVMQEEARREAAMKGADSLKIEQAGIIDIELPDNTGTMRKLSDLKGKVVMLDFHAFGIETSPTRIIMMRELYNKYHSQGLEIYQIAFDANEHFWKQQVETLPWVTVRDAAGANSTRLVLYNVKAIPDFFLIDRGSNLVCRQDQIKDLGKEIEKLLK